jgi:hypothetical protein
MREALLTQLDKGKLVPARRLFEAVGGVLFGQRADEKRPLAGNLGIIRARAVDARCGVRRTKLALRDWRPANRMD